MTQRNDQEVFWAEGYADDYIQKNHSFDAALGQDAWRAMLARAEGVNSILECGCNIGRNIDFLGAVLPDADKSVIEISRPAYDHVVSRCRLAAAFNGSILESKLDNAPFDLVFTMGVLIHIHPDNLLAHMKKMYGYSSKYVLMGEYFNRTPAMIDYQGQRDRLFKRDFGRMFIENFDVELVDYGFLWDYVYGVSGFDDITWWLFRKK